MSLFTQHQPRSAGSRVNQENEPYRPNVYAFSHIHATTTATPAPDAQKPRRSSSTKRSESAYKRALQPPTVKVRPMTGPVTKQLAGHGPFHPTAARPEQKRLDFSKPRVSAGRPLSEIDERAAAQSSATTELAPADTIRLFTSTLRKIQAAAVQARSYRTSAPSYVQAENNQPLSSHNEVTLERFDPEQSGFQQASSQPQVSANYIQRQTALRMASKAEQLEQYHRDVQIRLNRKVQEAKKEEANRKALLPSKVKRLVYDMQSATDTPADEAYQAVESHVGEVAHGLAQMDLLPYHQSAAPPAAVVQAWSEPSHQEVRVDAEQPLQPHADDAFGAASSRSHVAAAASSRPHASKESQRNLMSKAEATAYLQLVRKQEMERSRQLAQQARMNPSASSGQLSSRSSGRGRERGGATHAFGGALSRTPSPSSHSPPRPTPRGVICQAEERDDRHRNPRSFSVQQATAEQEAPDVEQVLHVPHPGLAAAAAQNKKARMSAAVAGRIQLKKKRATVDGTTAAAKNSAYRRLLLERLHALAATLNHPLPPLCACGFTPLEEYDLLFSYQGTGASGVAPPPAQQPAPGQLPFNLSTLIAQQPSSSSSIHHHTHAHTSQAAQMAQLPAHVALDSTRHAFQHKHNCQYYNNGEQYVKALANLLHTLEDQEQI